MTDARWAVARVATGGELDVAKRLRMESCEVYCPAHKWTLRSRRRKPVERESAILPSYLFIREGTIGNSETIIRWSDFHYFVAFANRWAMVSDAALDPLREIESARIALRPEKAAMPFRVGQLVRGVVDTLVSGMTGCVELTLPGYAVVAGGDFTKPMSVAVEMLTLEE